MKLLKSPSRVSLLAALAAVLGATVAAPARAQVGSPSTFDLVVGTGETVVLDTALSVLVDDDGDLNFVHRGRLVLRSLVVEPGGVLQLRGPFPLHAFASGRIVIAGEIELDGFDAKDVAGVNTATFPEPGAAGNLGGGKGGDASQQTAEATLRGGFGEVPFGLGLRAGVGGESGFGADPASSSQGILANPDFRKGAGGGGGAFGPDPLAPPPPTGAVGLVALRGGDGHPLSTGAILEGTPVGGEPGGTPFVDGDPANDFWGQRVEADGSVTLGELPRLWAGSGGGGGGDCNRTDELPFSSFGPANADKGGAGGGGAGGLYLFARSVVSLVDPLTGAEGRIVANGGAGARGQLVPYQNNFFTRSGPGGGGGSGGHVVVESLSRIELGSSPERIVARGGEGGPGTSPAGNVTAARGGDGGPGVIQLHAPGGLAGISSGGALNELCVPAPVVLEPQMFQPSR